MEMGKTPPDAMAEYQRVVSMTDITIPDEVVEAAARAIAADAKLNWDDVPYAHNVTKGEARAAIIAALKAWPGAFPHTFRGPLDGYGYVLPLTQETDA